MSLNSTQLKLVSLLADGCFHSGERLAQTLDMSRSAIWKHLKVIREVSGLVVDSVRGKGYRLADGLELLTPHGIGGQLSPASNRRLRDVVVHQEIDSTNSWLMAQAASGAPGGIACLAERQSGGRGRHGRQWISPFGSNIYLSLLWRFELAPTQLTGLSIACGVAVAQALAGIGVRGVALKWPNDVLWQRRKLAGLLLEVGGEAGGPSYVVAGVGINTRLSHTQAQGIDQPWVDLASIPGLQGPIRNRLAGQVLDRFVALMVQYGEYGLEPFLESWQQFDHFAGEQVQLNFGANRLSGKYLGIAPDGSIRLEEEGEIRTYNSGEVGICRPPE